MAEPAGVGDKPIGEYGAGWFALTETSLARLLREYWGRKILDQSGMKKDTGVQDFAEEVVAFLSNTAPIELRTPFALLNNTAQQAALNIINDDGNEGKGITITNGSTGDTVNISPEGINFYNIDIGGGGGGGGGGGDSPTNNIMLNNNLQFVQVNQDGDTYPINLSGPTFINNINTITDPPPGEGGGGGRCINETFLFKLEAEIFGRGSPATVNARRQIWNDTTKTYDDGISVPLKTDLVRGPASSGDLVGAFIDCPSGKYYCLTSARGWSGDFYTIYANSPPTLTVNSNCTITMTYTRYMQVFKNGVLKRVVGDDGTELASSD